MKIPYVRWYKYIYISKTNNDMKKSKLFFAILICLIFVFSFGNVGSNLSFASPTHDLIIYDNSNSPQMCAESEPFWRIFFPKRNKNGKAETANKVAKQVYVGGNPLGFTINLNGVVVVGISEVETETGKVCTVKNGQIKSGDILVALNETEICGAESIHKFLLNNYAGGIVKAKLIRNSQAIIADIMPAKDSLSGEYKLGLWIRDSSAGVGTLTYVTESGNFGALGHAVCDIDTGTLVPVFVGKVYKCNVIGVEKSRAGKPGELRGLFLKGGSDVGSLKTNTNCGVFGTIELSAFDNLKLVPVAEDDEIKMGKATMLSTIDGTKPIEIEIEIIKTNHKNSNGQKSFVIRMTDEQILEKTGGIVQGMSGSPIIQNGKLIGAVTHVFVNDATKGFGINISEMMKKTD